MAYSDHSIKLKVITVGNSFAVTLPRGACRLLKIDRTTKIEMKYDDNRLVLRPIARADRSGQPDRLAFAGLMRTLILHYELPQHAFERLSHDGTPWKTFLMDVDVGGHVDPVTVARLCECLNRRREIERTRQNESWAETADAILIAIPSSRPPRAG